MTAPHSGPAADAADDDPVRIVRRATAAALAYREATPAAVAAAPPLRVLRRMEGAGAFYHEGRLLGAVDYWLKDAVNEADARVFPTGHRERGEPVDARTAARGVFGFVRGATKENVLGPYVGVPLTLRLQDGGELELTVTKVLAAEAALFPNYLVQGAAPAE